MKSNKPQLRLPAIQIGRAWRRCPTLLLLALIATGCWELEAAQQIFWPLNQWPPPTWRYLSTNSAPVSFPVGLGSILWRNFSLTNLQEGTLVPPPTNQFVIYTNFNARLDSEFSPDAGLSWTPTTSAGSVRLFLRNNSDSNGIRVFDEESLSLGFANSGLGYQLRESPTRASLGSTVMTKTNGGFLIESLIYVSLELSLDNGTTWVAANRAAVLQLTGPPGIPAILSISRPVVTHTLLCWPSQTNVQYQLQRKDSLNPGSWSNIGSAMRGTGAGLCILDDYTVQTNHFYRLQLSP